jgi:hypothetical protein
MQFWDQVMLCYEQELKGFYKNLMQSYKIQSNTSITKVFNVNSEDWDWAPNLIKDCNA